MSKNMVFRHASNETHFVGLRRRKLRIVRSDRKAAELTHSAAPPFPNRLRSVRGPEGDAARRSALNGRFQRPFRTFAGREVFFPRRMSPGKTVQSLFAPAGANSARLFRLSASPGVNASGEFFVFLLFLLRNAGLWYILTMYCYLSRRIIPWRIRRRVRTRS